MTAFLVKWLGVGVLTYIIYLLCVSLGAKFVVITIGQMGFSLAFLLACVMFVFAARVAVK